MTAKRYVLGGIAQETNSFTGMPTTMGDFVSRGGDLERGRTVVAANRGVNTVVGGFIDDLEA
ncbi:MAG: M81 family metallopeptidase, partial [Trueperaceae bacterium]